jgi:hypothetical protein
MRPLARATAACFVFTLAIGCDCRGKSGVGQDLAELGVVWKDTDGTERVDRDATFDFGSALVGERIQLQMIVRNLGRGQLTLVSLEQTDGALVSIGADTKPDAYFEVKFTPVISIDAASDVAVDIAFTPRVGLKLPVAKLLLTAEGTRNEDNTAVITLKGQGEGGTCDLPTVLDFGDVPLGEHFKLGWTFKNTATIPITVHVGDIWGADAASFVSSVQGDAVVPAAGQTLAEFTFSPTELRAYQASVKMKGPCDCPEGDVVLKGNGADQVLTWTPSSIDYGYVSPMVSAAREVTFTNRSNVPIVLSGIDTDLMDFAYAPPLADTPTTFTVAGGGSSKLTVSCRPSALGLRSGTLFFDTPLSRTPHGVIDLKCTGGGPSIRVTPRPTLNFGRVGYFPGNSTYSVSRKVTVENVGTRPPNNDPKGNLYFGQVVNGVPGGFPLIELTPTNSTTAAGELDVGLPSSYDPMTGLVAMAGQNFADLTVTLKPGSVGAKEADLTLYSNDPVEPIIKVKVTADAEPLPPCNLSMTPTVLNFGLVTPPDHKDLGVTVKNLGLNANEICYLSGVELAAGSNPAFSLVGGPIDQKELQPQEVLSLVVRVWPTGAVPTTTQTLSGQLRFNVADPNMPSRTIPLQANIGPVCLTVVPDSYDFGNVKKDCNTGTREFTLYNTCNAAVFVQGITMQAAAGQPPGGPQCPGGSPCPEFFLTATPAIPTGGLQLAPGALTTFRAKYHPIDYGADSGAIAIAAVQAGQNVTYLVSLAGTGDMSGLQTDTFQQQVKPKADVLLIVDDSCSMTDKQMSLGTNFAAFLQYAQATGTDWQIGVTTTDAAPPICTFGICQGGLVNGKLLGNPKVLSPATPNVATVFAQRVIVGTNGGTETGLEAAVKALTPPLITADNAGFLRYDANLAVVVVSDAGDQGGQPYSYYLNRLRNVKGYQRANMFTFNDIGPYLASPPSGCTYDDYTDSATYHQLVADTSGVQAEICTTNWATKLQDLGKTAFGFRTTFYLSAEPDLTGGRMLDVKIDGAPVPNGDFTYDAATQAVVFQPMTTPGPGKTLTVSYFKACL